MKAKTQKKLSFLICTIIMVLLVSGCQSGSLDSLNPERTDLTILQGVDATTLDPAMHSDSPSGNVDFQIFDTLIARDDEMHIKAAVAKEWEMINDTSWKIKLREDVMFHNGDQLTAKDVKFSIDRIQDPASKSPRISHYSMISNIEIENDFSLIIETKEPYPVLLSRLAELRITPQKYITEVGNETFAREPVGSGPYRFVEWVKDERIVLEANDQYWGGSPPIKNVVFKPVPEASARVMALRAGEADLITNLPPHQVKELQQLDGVGTADVDSTRVIFLCFTTANKSVKDLRVRKALNHAVDKQSIVDNILEKNASLSTQIVSRFDLGYNSDLVPYRYDPEKALRLLSDAGYEKGLKITIKSPSGRYLMDKEVAEAVKLQLESLGIEVELIFEEWGSFVTRIMKGTMDADIWLIGWGSSTFDAGTTLKQWLYTPNKTAYYHVSKETNNHIDGLIDEALATMDESRRAETYHNIIQQVHNDAAFINLYQQKDLYGVSERIVFAPRSDELIDIKNIKWK